MTSKKPASNRRAAPPKACDHTKTFLKDWERLSRSGRYDLKRLKVRNAAAHWQRRAAGPEWLDHPLEGDWVDHRECHIGGDFLLIYRLDGNAIVFVRARTHSELFEEGFRHAVTTCRCAAPVSRQWPRWNRSWLIRHDRPAGFAIRMRRGSAQATSSPPTA